MTVLEVLCGAFIVRPLRNGNNSKSGAHKPNVSFSVISSIFMRDRGAISLYHYDTELPHDEMLAITIWAGNWSKPTMGGLKCNDFRNKLT